METPNSYEELRRQRVEANKKILMDLRIQQLSQSFAQEVASESKPQKREIKSKKLKQEGPVERRCSTRVSRNPIPIYREEDVDFPRHRKSRASYDSKRFLHIGSASYEARMQAKESAENMMWEMKSKHPFFIKSLVRSHVSSCFWLGLPSNFCREYLSQKDESMVLEDEQGNECDAVYIASRTGLSGGWRAFALDHDLDDGDAVIFELVDPKRFKVYITKAKDFETSTALKVSSMDNDVKKGSAAAKRLVGKKTSNLKIEKENSPRERKTANGNNKGKQSSRSVKAATIKSKSKKAKELQD